MPFGRTAYAVVVSVLAIAAVRCTSGPPPPADDRPYDVRVRAARAQKDADFKAMANEFSPIPPGERAAFSGLPYYPIRAEYRVPAALT